MMMPNRAAVNVATSSVAPWRKKQYDKKEDDDGTWGNWRGEEDWTKPEGWDGSQGWDQSDGWDGSESCDDSEAWDQPVEKFEGACPKATIRRGPYNDGTGKGKGGKDGQGGKGYKMTKGVSKGGRGVKSVSKDGVEFVSVFEWWNYKQSHCITAPAAPAAPAAQPATPLGLDPSAPARAVAPEAPEDPFYIVERHLGGQMYPFCVWCWKITNGESRSDFSSTHFTGKDHLKKLEMATQYKAGPVECAELQEKFIIERDEFLAPRTEANDVTAAAAVNGEHGDRLQLMESRFSDVEMAVGAILEILQDNNWRA